MKKKNLKSSTKLQTSDEKISPSHPRFFRIILQDTLSQGKIGLPRRYVMKHRNDLLGSSTVVLKLPDGKKWPMGLTISDGTIWLQDGWEEFAQHYHLKHGSFLVFQYDGSSFHFEVIIFDLSATEIDYPSPSNAGEEGTYTMEAYHEQDEVVGDNDVNEDEDEDDDDVSVEIIGESMGSPDVQNRMEESADHGATKRQKRHTKEEVAKALAIANSFKSINPFFKVFMRASYIGPRGCGMAIPTEFAKKHTSMKITHAILKLADGRSWEVLYHCWRIRGSIHQRFSFRHGWNEFMKDTHLKVGDVCIFELVNPRKLVFEVTIYSV